MGERPNNPAPGPSVQPALAKDLDDDTLVRMRESLKQRCVAARIDYHEETTTGGLILSVFDLPDGRSSRTLYVGKREIEGLLSFPFEDCRFINGYHAICSHAEGSIEAVVRVIADDQANQRLDIYLSGGVFGEPDPAKRTLLQVESPTGVTIRVGAASTRLVTLYTSTRSTYFEMAPHVSVMITGLDVTRHDDALDCLEQMAMSLFFALDQRGGPPLRLMRQGESTDKPMGSRRFSDVPFPQAQYDRIPLAYYWEAKAAAEMPLIQFLSYYQVIEYYFPVYAEQEIMQRLRTLLRDPQFSAYSDRDLSRVLGVMTPRGARIAQKEVEQLKATLRGCIIPSDLKSFVNDDDRRKEHVQDKEGQRTLKSLSSHTVNLAAEDLSFIDVIADRIYDIRCRIVHTKSTHESNDQDMIFPLPRTQKALWFDIQLIEYVAQRVLINNAKELQLPAKAPADQ